MHTRPFPLAQADLVHDKPDAMLRMSAEISGHPLRGLLS